MTRAAHLLPIAAFVAACGGAPGSSNVPGGAAEPRAASVWRSKCGACHVPIEPGALDRGAIEDALRRHRKRVRLTEDQWTELVDFLARAQSQQASAD